MLRLVLIEKRIINKATLHLSNKKIRLTLAIDISYSDEIALTRQKIKTMIR